MKTISRLSHCWLLWYGLAGRKILSTYPFVTLRMAIVISRDSSKSKSMVCPVYPRPSRRYNDSVSEPGPLLASRDASVLVVIDIQEKLLPAIHGGEAILPRVGLLLEGAKAMGVPVILTEQYPQGLGPTVEGVRRDLPPGTDPVTKTAFSCVPEPAFMAKLKATGRRQAVIAGIEAHVCVAQTALELVSAGFQVFLAADAVGSRRPADRDTALDRMRRAGVVVTTSEALVFEWLRRAGTPEFKAVQRRIKEIP